MKLLSEENIDNPIFKTGKYGKVHNYKFGIAGHYDVSDLIEYDVNDLF